jgi:hypothetical protein
VLGIATAGVTATVVAVLVGRSTAAAPTERGAVVSHASLDVSAPVPDALEMAEVHIATNPAGARVTVDERTLGAAPITTRVRLGATLAVRAELEGFVATDQVIRADELRREVVVSLAPVPPPPDAGIVDAPPPVAKQTVTSPPRRTPPVEPPTAPPSTKTKPEPRGSAAIKPDDVGGD